MVSQLQTDLCCPHCQRPCSQAPTTVVCPHCHTAYHNECWDTHGCATADCPSRVVTPLPLVSGQETAPRLFENQAGPNKALPICLGVVMLLIAGFSLAKGLGVSTNHLLVFAVVLAALGFDFVNGMNDSGNAIATVISTRALSPLSALFMAAVLNFIGALLMEGVAKSIAGKIVGSSGAGMLDVTPLMILCGLLGAIGWAYMMARIGLPISMSHSLIGGLVGVLLLAGISLNYSYLIEILVWMILAPVLGISFGWLLMVAIMWIFRRVAPCKMNQHFRVWQVVSSGLMAFSHGANDAQKAMGIITLALVSGGVLHVAQGSDPHIPIWVKLACAAVIALGTGLGGKKVIGTLGHKIFKLTPVHGFAAETVAAATIQLATGMHVPISTTHVISSSILGVGSSKRLSAVRWGVAGNIITAWVFTIPTCGVAAAILYALVRAAGAPFGLH